MIWKWGNIWRERCPWSERFIHPGTTGGRESPRGLGAGWGCCEVQLLGAGPGMVGLGGRIVQV